MLNTIQTHQHLDKRDATIFLTRIGSGFLHGILYSFSTTSYCFSRIIAPFKRQKLCSILVWLISLKHRLLGTVGRTELAGIAIDELSIPTGPGWLCRIVAEHCPVSLRWRHSRPG